MATKIGVISDTHSAGSGRDLPMKILEALKGVDMILHCGDLECLGVLDYLEEVAPLLAVRGYEDPVEEGERLALTTRVVKVEGVSIGMIHDIQWPGPKIQTSPDGADLILPEANGREIMARKFKEPVDIVLYGDTHEEIVTYWDGIMIMNPGSPTYPGKRHKRGALGTLGILEIDGEDAAGRIVELDLAGLVSSI
ncbi:MAG: metallophosphoesterase family protein [Chloroflexota bacterium]|nr:metallophosphoesterase family protein [Chloroflexota bacterium]MED5404609.1 metallophosphoesterase family protein [Chloroflexota bacterium]MEE3247279.1 metallophosphoesterase family protein [Chloroflexota bacterium]MEE3250306.1 metallophosphoesterase family protein [Chloroflexota bacterium]|tara:strand:- start:798 stop:1382 length:585 start_codon:yes stop_codon:yes gene_type:complete